MNNLVSFRLCSLSDEELIQKLDEQTDKMFKEQKVPSSNIPARPNDDYDLLVGELILRFSDLIKQKPRKSPVKMENSKLLKEIENTINGLRVIRIRRVWNSLEIRISTESGFTNLQVLPIDHIYDSKIVECIRFINDKLDIMEKSKDSDGMV